MIIIVILVMVVAVALVGVANANRQSQFSKDYEQSYYSAESAAMFVTELFRQDVAAILEEEGAGDQSGLFYSPGAMLAANNENITQYVQRKLSAILQSIIELPAVVKMIEEDDLFEGQIPTWVLSVNPIDGGITEDPNGMNFIADSIVGITASTSLRDSTVNIHYHGEMGSAVGASGGNLLEAEDKANEIKGILADRDRFFDMAGEITGLDINDPETAEQYGAFNLSASGNFYGEKVYIFYGSTSGAIAPVGGNGMNNLTTQQIIVQPSQSVNMSSTFQIQLPELQNIFIEPSTTYPITSQWRGGYLIFRSSNYAEVKHSTGRFVITTGNVHFDGRHEGAMTDITTPPLYSGAFNNIFGHRDTRASQGSGAYDYYSFYDYGLDTSYQPLGTNFYVGGGVIVDCTIITGGTVHFINNARIAAKEDIMFGFSGASQPYSPYIVSPLPNGTIIRGNSVYITEGNIIINSAGDLQLGEKDGLGPDGAQGRSPHFISIGNTSSARHGIIINYTPGSKIKLYGVFGTLGDYYGPNFVEDTNVDVAGVIYAAGVYYDSATGEKFDVPAGFWDRPEHKLPEITEYLDTSFFSHGFSMSSDRIVSIVAD